MTGSAPPGAPARPEPSHAEPGEHATPPAGASAEITAPEWHRVGPEEVLASLGATAAGLPSSEATARLASSGRNELVDRGSKSPLTIIREQLTAVMVLILIAAAALSLVLGKLLEAGAIGTVVVLFTALGFLQEYRAERAIAALRRMTVPAVRVRRDGEWRDVPAPELVPGDIVALEAGNVVAADLRLLDSAGLRIQEAALTGEAEPVDKDTAAIDQEDVPLGDRRNMAYSGTQVTYGRGTGLVVATGMDTQLGHIAALLGKVDAGATPLQRRLDRVGKQLAVLGAVVAAVVVALGAASGEAPGDLVLTAIGVAVAVIPEGLPAVVTVTLAVGAQRMLRRNALIRKLPAVETLGSVTVICSDKTGTLTQNRMTVTVVHAGGTRVDLDDAASGDDGGTGPSRAQRGVRLTLAAAALCNDGELRRDEDGREVALGDPTETALLAGASRLGLDVEGLRSGLARVGERPFDSERKRMSTVHRVPADALGPAAELAALAPGGGHLALVKGAVDGLLAHTSSVLDGNGEAVPLTEARRAELLAANDDLASRGVRVLGVAHRALGAPEDDAESALTLVGLVGLVDPPRPEAAAAIARCADAGVRTLMITGDHPLPAAAIARELGITDDGRALTGADLDRLDDRGLRAAVGEVSVFARVAPEHKLRIVDALRAEGRVVAMTGDGVNDAPALKQADIGVAMGITGTDVSKEAADMVLRDDDFSTIVAAVEEGRVIYDNLRRFVRFAVAGNIGKILVMVGWPIPFLLTGTAEVGAALLPLQLLWLNLMTDGLLGLSMGMEPPERGVMQRPPHTPGASIWAGGLARQATVVGVLIGLTALAVGFAYHGAGAEQWQTMMFTSLAFLQVFQAFGTRSSTEPLWRIGWRTNPVMLAVAGAVVALQLLALYTPLAGLLDLEPLGALDLVVCVGLGAGLLAVLEAAKLRRLRSPGESEVSPVAVAART